MKNGKGRTARIPRGESVLVSAAVNLPSGIVFLIQGVAMYFAIQPRNVAVLRLFENAALSNIRTLPNVLRFPKVSLRS